MMLERRVVGSVGIAIVVLVGARAADARNTLQGSAQLLTGVTTLGAADQVAFTGEVRPTLLFTSEQGRLSQRLRGAVLFSVAAPQTSDALCVTKQGSVACSLGGVIDWNAGIATSPSTSLLLSANLTLGQYAGVNSLGTSDQTFLGAVRLVSNTTLQLAGGEWFQWTPSERWAFTESAFYGAFVPVDTRVIPESHTVGTTVNIDHLWRIDAFGLELDGRYGWFSNTYQTNPDGTETRTARNRQSVTTTALLRWRRDWTPLLSTEAGAGALVVSGRAGETDADRIWRSTPDWAARASVNYLFKYGNLGAVAAHGARPNIFAGETFVVDEVALRLGTPYERYNLTFNLGAGYQYARIVTGGNETGAMHIALADGSLGWRPRDEVGLSVRYQLLHQRQASGAPLEGGGSPDTTRHLALFVLDVVYPTDRRAGLPGRPSRVDGSDAVR